MGFYASRVRTLQNEIRRDQVGVFKNVLRVNVSGTPRLPLLQGAIVTATHHEDVAELSTLISGDVPPWLSEGRLSGGPR